MGKVEVTKVKVSGKSILTSDKGQRIEIENPEILLIKKTEKGK